ncbi:MAG: glycoside hydrolase family 38 C-terminal domain-containing protein [Bryobacteraceae bacterium]
MTKTSFLKSTFLAAVLAGGSIAGAQAPPTDGYTFYVAPHSHIDIVWYWTYDHTIVVTNNILRHALDLMRRDPRYTFTQDQMIALEPFWNTLSAGDKEFMRRMVRERRFELATGMYLQPDEAESDFESLVRQFYPALSWMENTFSTKVTTAWNLDTYGHTPQAPQLFRKAGLSNFVFMRDVLPSLQASIKSPFYWQGADGTKILAYWLSGSYSHDWRGTSENLRRFVDHHAPSLNDILLLWGGDVYLPTETTADMEAKIRDAAGKANIPIKKIVFCTPSQYFEMVQKSGVKLPTYQNDFNPALYIQDLRGLYGERPATKIANRRSEYILESAEKFSSIASGFGLDYPAQPLHNAWMKVIFNQDHDALPGSHIDPVDDNMMSRYAGAIEAGRSALFDSFQHISTKVDTSRAKHFPFLVFNPSSFQATEAVKYTPLFKEQIGNFRLLDDAGNPVPFRTDFAGRRETNEPLSMAAIEFVAREVPPMGYRLYQLESLQGSIELPKPQTAEEQISNRYFTVAIDLKTGGIRSIVSRETGEELLDSAEYQGNELVIEEEKDPDMEGMLHFTETEVRMKQFPVDSITETRDDIGTRVRLSGPFLSGRRQQEIRLYNDIPRIDFKTDLLGFPGHDGLLTAVFPLRAGEPVAWNYETHNAVTTRPDGIYYAQTFVDAQRSKGGVAFVNHGMGGVHTKGDLLRLILLRSITDYKGYYSPNASEAGSHSFEYSLYAHSGDWRNGVVQQAHSFNTALVPFATDAHSGSLPAPHSFLKITEGDFEVTAFKRSEDGKSLILRGHETMGRKGRVTVSLDRAPVQAWMSDLTERPGRKLAFQQGKLQFDCNPFEFVTLRLDEKP